MGAKDETHMGHIISMTNAIQIISWCILFYSVEAGLTTGKAGQESQATRLENEARTLTLVVLLCCNFYQ